MLAWRETARIQREGIARLVAVPLKIVARTCEPRAHSSLRVEQREKHEKRLDLSPRPLRSLAPGFRFRFAISRVFATIEKGTVRSSLRNRRKIIFLARHVILPALARAHSRALLSRSLSLSHQNINFLVVSALESGI